MSPWGVFVLEDLVFVRSAAASTTPLLVLRGEHKSTSCKVRHRHMATLSWVSSLTSSSKQRKQEPPHHNHAHEKAMLQHQNTVMLQNYPLYTEELLLARRRREIGVERDHALQVASVRRDLVLDLPASVRRSFDGEEVVPQRLQVSATSTPPLLESCCIRPPPNRVLQPQRLVNTATNSHSSQIIISPSPPSRHTTTSTTSSHHRTVTPPLHHHLKSGVV